MVVSALAVASGLWLSFACRGHFARLKTLGMRGEPLLLLLLALQALFPAVRLEGTWMSVAYWLWLLTYPLLVGLCLWNSSHRPMLIVAAGLVLNGLVIGLNRGMPVSSQAVGVAVEGAHLLIRAGDFAHVVMSSSTRLPWLGDILPLVGPSALRGVASPGDLLLGCGVSSLIARVTISIRACPPT